MKLEEHFGMELRGNAPEVDAEEIREISRHEKLRALIHPHEAGRLVNQIALVAEMPDALPRVRRSPDLRDDFVLAVCEAGRADWLATGDKADLLALKRQGRTHIVTAAVLAERLGL